MRVLTRPVVLPRRTHDNSMEQNLDCSFGSDDALNARVCTTDEIDDQGDVTMTPLREEQEEEEERVGHTGSSTGQKYTKQQEMEREIEPLLQPV